MWWDEDSTNMNHFFKGFAMDLFASFKNPLLDMLILISQSDGGGNRCHTQFFSLLFHNEREQLVFQSQKKKYHSCFAWDEAIAEMQNKENLWQLVQLFLLFWSKWLWHINSDWMHYLRPLLSSLAPPLGIWVPFFKLNWALLEAVCQIPSVPLRLFEYSTESSRWLIA